MTDSFESLAKIAAKAKGKADIELVVIKGPIGGVPVDQVMTKIDTRIDEVIIKLTAPRKTSDSSRVADVVQEAETIQLKVEHGDYSVAVYEHGWTDGLPVVLPTRARVEAMLMGTSHSPSEVVAQLPPEGGAATVEAIAINAVMAGCTGEHLPIVLAGVEAIGDPANGMAAWASTTGPNSPMFIVSGPVCDQVGLNYGVNALGTGTRANATIGRALSLIIRNIGGARPGVTDMTTIGAPWEYTMCFGENAKATPANWSPLNEDQGFAGASTVTAKCINSQVNVFCHNAVHLEQVLDTIAAGIAGINNFAILHGQGLVIVLCPEIASLAERDDWSRSAIRQYLFEKARQPLQTWLALGDNCLVKTLLPEKNDESPDFPMRMMPGPDNITIVVAGGAGKHCQWWAGGQGAAVTKSIEAWR